MKTVVEDAIQPDYQDDAYQIAFASMSHEERVMHLVLQLETAINKGGFHEFFYSSAGNHAQETLNALLVIKAINVAVLLRRAMWIFVDGMPPKGQETRRRIMDNLGENEVTLLRELDGKFFSNDDLTRLLRDSLLERSRYSSLVSSV